MHVLIDCVDVADIRQNFYNGNNLYDLFTNVAGDTISEFLKDFLCCPTLRRVFKRNQIHYINDYLEEDFF
jgi:hypothetical protein